MAAGNGALPERREAEVGAKPAGGIETCGAAIGGDGGLTVALPLAPFAQHQPARRPAGGAFQRLLQHLRRGHVIAGRGERGSVVEAPVGDEIAG